MFVLLFQVVSRGHLFLCVQFFVILFFFLVLCFFSFFFFFSSRRRHTRLVSDWSSDVCLFRSRIESIDERRPQEFQRIREPNPRQEADGRQRRPFVAHPVAEGVAGEEKGQTGGEAQHEHHRQDRKSVV